MAPHSSELDVHRDTRVRISMAALWGILLCCITATAFIVRLSGQVETLAHEMVQMQADSREIRAQHLLMMRELAELKRGK